MVTISGWFFLSALHISCNVSVRALTLPNADFASTVRAFLNPENVSKGVGFRTVAEGADLKP